MQKYIIESFKLFDNILVAARESVLEKGGILILNPYPISQVYCFVGTPF